MLRTREELSEINRLIDIRMILTETFATVIRKFTRENFVFEYFVAVLEDNGNDVTKILIVVVFDSIDEDLDDPFDDRLTFEQTLIEENS